MSINVPVHPLDLTGAYSNNKIVGEIHDLGTYTYRTVIPNFGAYYTNSLVVRDTSNGNALTAHDDYVAILYYEEPSIRSGLEVCAGILVTKQNVSEVEIEYQAVGGEYESVTPILIDLIDQFDIGDPQQVAWGDLLGVPDAFPPTPHLHKISDIYGFEDIVYILGEIRNVILEGDVAKTASFKQLLEDHKNSGDHDNRYYTKTQSDNRYYTQSQVNSAIGGAQSDHIASNTRTASDGMQINHNDRIIVDTSSSPISMLAPSSPSPGDVFSVYDFGGNLSNNVATINRNGENIMELSQDIDLNIDNRQYHFEYKNSTEGWRIT